MGWRVAKLRSALISAILAFVASVISLPSDAASVCKPQNHEPKFTKGLFWQISKQGIPAGYVLGTIHSDDERITNLNQQVQDALAKSVSFSLETLPDVHAPRMLQDAMILENDQKLEALIGSDLYHKVSVQLLDNGIPDNLVQRIKPWGAMLNLYKPKWRKGLLLDDVLLTTALRQHKPVSQVEKLEELISAFDSIPMDTQVAVLGSLVDRGTSLSSTREEMVDAYLREDLAEMWKINATSVFVRPKGKTHHDKIFLKHMVANRNQVMAYYMQNLMREGLAFFAVGALHLYGDQSILRLLEDEGFQVTRIN